MERELLLLGLLRQQHMHGYRLNEFIERDMATCTDLKKPTAYFLLDKMTKEGWIAHHPDREGNRPVRRVYEITPKGEAEFQRLLRENLSAYMPAKFPGDVGLAFADALQPDEAVELLQHRREALVAQLEAMRAVPHHGGTLQLLIQHQVFHLESELAWLEQVIAQLAQPQSNRAAE